MANDTQISKLDDAVHKLKEIIDRQQQLLTELVHQIATMDNKYEQIFQESTKNEQRH